jgi:alpha-beta hydrolase superfamily lysophospholipase
VTTRTRRVDVGDVAPAGVRTLAVDVHLPDEVGTRPVVCCCVPGGGMSRGYFDVQAPPAVGNYSMARHLVDRGFVVITLDPPGVGESDVPDDGYTLTPDAVADVNARAFDQLLEEWPDAYRVGVGHSAGALLTVVQQARHRSHDALGLFGFGRGGHEQFALTPEEREQAGGIVALTRQRFGDPLPGGGSTTTSPFLLGGMEVPREALAALGAVKTRLLGVVGLTSMIPGSVDTEMAAVDVPVFLALGERDIAGDAHGIPACFSGCGDFTLFVLPGAGHNHNVAPDRELLWDRFLVWARSIAPDHGTGEPPT